METMPSTGGKKEYFVKGFVMLEKIGPKGNLVTPHNTNTIPEHKYSEIWCRGSHCHNPNPLLKNGVHTTSSSKYILQQCSILQMRPARKSAEGSLEKNPWIIKKSIKSICTNKFHTLELRGTFQLIFGLTKNKPCVT